jgi:hypothetical protein
MMEIDQVAARRTTLDFHLLLTQSNPPARISLPTLWSAPAVTRHPAGFPERLLYLQTPITEVFPMSALTFDTYEFIKDLQAKGFREEQAEGISNALKNALTIAEIATKHDINELRLEFKAEIAPLKWGMGICAAGIVSLVVKAFF